MSNKNLDNFYHASRLYSEGIQWQIDFENKEVPLSEEDAQTLESIREYNQKLYDYMRQVRREL